MYHSVCMNVSSWPSLLARRLNLASANRQKRPMYVFADQLAAGLGEGGGKKVGTPTGTYLLEKKGVPCVRGLG